MRVLNEETFRSPVRWRSDEKSVCVKLLIVIPSFFPATIYGGPIFSTLYASRALAARSGMEVSVATTNANMTSRLDVVKNRWTEIEPGVHVKYYNDTWINKLSLPLFFNLWRDVRKADFIHVQGIFSTPTPVALFYAKWFKKPVLLSPRGAFAPWIMALGATKKRRWLDIMIRPMAKNIRWHATSDQEKDEILTHFPVASVVIVPNGIDLDAYAHVNRLSKKAFVQKYADRAFTPEHIVISMGRLHAKKGFDILIDAFSRLGEGFENSVLMIAGDDETEQANLEAQIERLGLKERVFLVGAVSAQDKIDFLANADLFVLPSHNENFGNVYVESLAAGTPIIASKNTPWQSVETFECGLWIENDIASVTQGMTSMLGADIAKKRENAKKLAKNYQWDTIAKQFETVYNNNQN